MSTFEVKVREVTQITPHPNADKLELIVIGGYMAVVQKGIHKVGDPIVYIPEDTVFKNLSIAEKLGVASYLTGKQKNRVKAIRLRGCLSQGIVLPKSAFEGKFPFFNEVTGKEDFWTPITTLEEYLDEIFVTCSEDIISLLELEKYEEPIPLEMAGEARRWPSFLPKYDMENIKRPESMNALSEGEEVVATEKLHGTNIAVAWGPGLDEGENVFVCSRNFALKESETNVYWRAVRDAKLDQKLQAIMDSLQQYYPTGVESLSLHGEVVGVQDLKYGNANGHIAFYAFDIRVNGEFLNYDDFVFLTTSNGIRKVPEVYRGPYNYETLKELAEGETLIGGGHIKEGLVVKPVKERYDIGAGRVMFKFISEAYLLRKGGTELH